jgi:hypothetical protein
VGLRLCEGRDEAEQEVGWVGLSSPVNAPRSLRWMTEDKGIPDADALHEYLAFGCLTLALRSFATLYHRFIILNTHERITYPKENMSSTALKLGLTSKMLCHVFIQLLVK